MKKSHLETNIKFCFFIFISIIFLLLWSRSHVVAEDNFIASRPFVGLTEITAEVLGENITLKQISYEDEILFRMKFDNKGASLAKIEFINVSVFNGYISSINKKEKEISLDIEPVIGKLEQKGMLFRDDDFDKNVPIKPDTLYKNVILLPKQSITYKFLSNAKLLKEALLLGEKHSNPRIFISEIKYSDLSGNTYFYNSVFRFVWYRAVNNVFNFMMENSSNKQGLPIFTLKRFTELILLAQEKAKKKSTKKGEEDLKYDYKFEEDLKWMKSEDFSDIKLKESDIKSGNYLF